MATARTHAACAFGARIQLDPRSTPGPIDAELQDLQALIIDMASEPDTVIVTLTSLSTAVLVLPPLEGGSVRPRAPRR